MKTDNSRLQEVDLKLKVKTDLLNNIKPLKEQIDSKISKIQNEIYDLENERFRLSQGQVLFDSLEF